MSATQIDSLIRMANQIALNMAAWGDEEAVVAKVREHMEKFWTRAMREQLLEFWRAGGEGLSPVTCRLLASMDGAAQTQERTS